MADDPDSAVHETTLTATFVPNFFSLFAAPATGVLFQYAAQANPDGEAEPPNMVLATLLPAILYGTLTPVRSSDLLLRSALLRPSLLPLRRQLTNANRY